MGILGVEENPLLGRARATDAEWCWFPLARLAVAVEEDSVLMRGAVTVGTVMPVASEWMGFERVVWTESEWRRGSLESFVAGVELRPVEELGRTKVTSFACDDGGCDRVVREEGNSSSSRISWILPRLVEGIPIAATDAGACQVE